MFRSYLWRAALLRGNFLCRQSITSFANFLNFAAKFQVLQYAWKIATAAVLEAHAVRDPPNAGRFFQASKINEYICVTRFLGTLIVASSFVLVFQRERPDDNRLSEFSVRSKDNDHLRTEGSTLA